MRQSLLDSISCQEVSTAWCECVFRMMYADMKIMEVFLICLNEMEFRSVKVYTCKVDSLVCRPKYKINIYIIKEF